MDREFGRLMAEDTPELNPLTANGLAVEHMRYLEPYVDQVFHMISREFPDGLKYEGSRRCTPLEEYREASRKKASKSTIDIAHSDFYLMRYDFSFEGVPLKPKFIYLPFVTDACIMHVNNSRYLVSPVLSDRVFSPGERNIFTRLLRARFYVERENHHFKMNNQRHTVQVVWSMIYNRPDKVKKLKKTVNMNCSLMHYLLAKYGFTETFARFAKVVPVVGTLETITEVDYPPDQWVIAHTAMSANAKPKGAQKGTYIPTNIALAIPREDMARPIVKTMVGSFFYIADHFPDRVDPRYLDDPHGWVVLLGHIIFSGTLGDGKLANDIYAHIASLDDYIDELIARRLREINIHVKDVYELFAILIEEFNDRIRRGIKMINSMYEKELSIVPFMLHELIVLIFKMNFKLKAAAKKGLKQKDIEGAMNIIKTGKLFSLPKECGCLSTTSTPGDNKAFKLTSILIPQSKSHKPSSKGDRVVVDDISKRLHVSVAEVGVYSGMPKSEPSGRERLNLCVRFDETGLIQRNERFREMLDEVQEDIRRQ
jgi:hypothetical protein